MCLRCSSSIRRSTLTWTSGRRTDSFLLTESSSSWETLDFWASTNPSVRKRALAPFAQTRLSPQSARDAHARPDQTARLNTSFSNPFFPQIRGPAFRIRMCPQLWPCWAGGHVFLCLAPRGPGLKGVENSLTGVWVRAAGLKCAAWTSWEH